MTPQGGDPFAQESSCRSSLSVDKVPEFHLKNKLLWCEFAGKDDLRRELAKKGPIVQIITIVVVEEQWWTNHTCTAKGYVSNGNFHTATPSRYYYYCVIIAYIVKPWARYEPILSIEDLPYTLLEPTLPGLIHYLSVWFFIGSSW